MLTEVIGYKKSMRQKKKLIQSDRTIHNSTELKKIQR